MILRLLVACGGLTCEAAVDDDVRTALALSAHGRGDLAVTYDPGDGDVTTPPAADVVDHRDHKVGLFGLTPLADVPWTAVLTRGSQESTCEGVTAAGNLPSGLPDLVVTVDDRERQSPERYLLGSASGEGAALFVIDRQGTWRWYREGADDRVIPDVEFRRGTNRVWFTEQALDRTEDVGRIAEIGLDGEEGPSFRIPSGHHVFAQGPDGDVAWLAIDVRRWRDPDTGETSDLVGDTVWITHTDGTDEPLFSIWDHLTPVPRENWNTGFYPQGLDWSHGNGLNWSPERRSYAVSFGNAQVIFEIDDTSGEVLRQFGGMGGYRYTEGSTHLFHQHDAKFSADGTLLVATTNPAPTGGSGAIEYAIDDDARTIDEIWSYGLDNPLRAASLGQVIPLQNGNRLVSLGGSGVLREVAPDGDVVWQVETGSGSAFANVWPFDDFYAPSAP